MPLRSTLLLFLASSTIAVACGGAQRPAEEAPRAAACPAQEPVTGSPCDLSDRFEPPPAGSLCMYPPADPARSPRGADRCHCEPPRGDRKTGMWLCGYVPEVGLPAAPSSPPTDAGAP